MKTPSIMKALVAIAALTAAPAFAQVAPVTADGARTLSFATPGTDPVLMLDRYKTTTGAFAPLPGAEAQVARSVATRDSFLPEPVMQSRPRVVTFAAPDLPTYRAPSRPEVASRSDSRLSMGNYWSLGAFR